MRKNQYEEALFKCEDDQFEIDMIIDTNTSAIRILGKLICTFILFVSSDFILFCGSLLQQSLLYYLMCFLLPSLLSFFISFTYLPTYPPTYLPTYLPTYPPTYLPTHLPSIATFHPPSLLPLLPPFHPLTHPPLLLPFLPLTLPYSTSSLSLTLPYPRNLTEPIAEEIGSLRLLMDTERAAPRFSFQLEKRSLGTVHLNAITRYGYTDIYIASFILFSSLLFSYLPISFLLLSFLFISFLLSSLLLSFLLASQTIRRSCHRDLGSAS